MTALDRGDESDRRGALTEGIEGPGAERPPGQSDAGHGGHGRWMMIACCVPMLVIAVSLVATGVAGAGFILIALMCTAMMVLMMSGMSHGGGAGGGR